MRKLDDAIIRALKRRAAEHGVSGEEEVRRILAQALIPGEDFKAHLIALGEASPDLILDRPRKYSRLRNLIQ